MLLVIATIAIVFYQRYNSRDRKILRQRERDRLRAEEYEGAPAELR